METNSDWDGASKKDLKDTSRKLLLKYRGEMMTILKKQ